LRQTIGAKSDLEVRRSATDGVANEVRVILAVPPIGTASVFVNGLAKENNGVPLITVTGSVAFAVAAPVAVSPMEYVPAATDASVVTKMREGTV
jgi:hypothetical protein